MTVQRKKNDPLSMKETIEFETATRTSVEDFWDKAGREDRPRMELLATMAWIRVKREEPDLSFVEYIDRSSLQDVLDDIGGDEDEEEKKEPTPSRGKRVGKPSSVETQE